MASEDFRRPVEAPWSVNEIRYFYAERERVKDDAQLLEKRWSGASHVQMHLAARPIAITRPSGAQDEYTLAAIAMNLRRIAKLITQQQGKAARA